MLWRDGMGWDGVEWDRMWQDGVGWDEMGWEGEGGVDGIGVRSSLRVWYACLISAADAAAVSSFSCRASSDFSSRSVSLSIERDLAV